MIDSNEKVFFADVCFQKNLVSFVFNLLLFVSKLLLLLIKLKSSPNGKFISGKELLNRSVYLAEKIVGEASHKSTSHRLNPLS